MGGAVRPEMGSPQPGEAAPDFSLPNSAGDEVNLSSLRGSWTLVHFTAAWCAYCDSEVEHLGRIADARADIKVVLVDVKDPSSVWLPYARAHVSPNVISLHDATGTTAAHFAPPHAQQQLTDRWQVVLDSTLIVDPQGKIRLFLLPDSAHFDPTFGAVREELSQLRPEEVVGIHLASSPSTCGVMTNLKVMSGYHIMSDHPSEPT